jgi:hypothetical protein
MEELRDKVLEMINLELNKSGLDGSKFIDHFVCGVLTGIYAFRLVWDEDYKVIEVIDLDWRLLRFKDSGYSVSIDGGKRFQWNSTEILFLNPSALREWKLNNILN